VPGRGGFICGASNLPVEQAMFKRLTLLWTLMRGEARTLWRALRHPQAPGWLKVGTALIVLYVISPIDLIPDFIPFFGAVDDLLVVTFGLRWLLSRLPAHIASDIR
jgi:uncharacterized membrane protein YkvA (DUF1232 family)